MTDKLDDKDLVPKENPRSPQEPWQQIQQELKSALSSWDDLSKKLGSEPSSEDRKMQEVRSLLESIRCKLDDLSKP